MNNHWNTKEQKLTCLITIKKIVIKIFIVHLIVDDDYKIIRLLVIAFLLNYENI